MVDDDVLRIERAGCVVLEPQHQLRSVVNYQRFHLRESFEFHFCLWWFENGKYVINRSTWQGRRASAPSSTIISSAVSEQYFFQIWIIYHCHKWSMVHWSSTPFTDNLETRTLDYQIIQTTKDDYLKSAITGFEQKSDSNAFLQMKKVPQGSA